MTVTEFLAALPDDRRAAIKAIRRTLKANMDKAVRERVESGMLQYYIPLKVYPGGYHCNPSTPLPFIALASQKSHIGLYLFCTYCVPEESERFREEWLATGKKLNMGKSCVRIRKLEDVPLDVLGRTIKRMTLKKFIKSYEAAVPASRRKKATKKSSPGQTTRKKSLTRKTTTGKKASRRR